MLWDFLTAEIHREDTGLPKKGKDTSAVLREKPLQILCG